MLKVLISVRAFTFLTTKMGSNGKLTIHTPYSSQDFSFELVADFLPPLKGLEFLANNKIWI